MEAEGWSARPDQYVKKGVSFGIIPDGNSRPQWRLNSQLVWTLSGQ